MRADEEMKVAEYRRKHGEARKSHDRWITPSNHVIRLNCPRNFFRETCFKVAIENQTSVCLLQSAAIVTSVARSQEKKGDGIVVDNSPKKSPL